MTDFVGFDIGTTSIKVAYYSVSDSKIINVQFDDGNNYFPVYYARSTSNKSEKYGNDAKNAMGKNAWTVAYEIKRLLGKKYTDDGVKEELERLTFPTTEIEDGKIGIVFKSGKSQMIMTPLQIYEKILLRVIDVLDNQQIKHENAVITVPNDFADAERNLLKDMFITNLKFQRVKIMNEPSAAALDFLYEENTFGKYAVFDYGGGTLDLSVVEYAKVNDKFKFTPLKHSGLRDNGGSDIDARLLNYIYKYIEEEDDEYCDQILAYAKKIKAKLKEQCEQGKKTLTDLNECVISFDVTVTKDDDDEEDINYEVRISRDEFNSFCDEIFTKSIDTFTEMIDEYKDELKGILMVGGTSKIPRVQELINEKTGIKPLITDDIITAVSRGAAYRGTQVNLDYNVEVATYSVAMLATHPLLGIPYAKTIIKKNTRLPKELSLNDTSISADGQQEIKLVLYKNCENSFSEKNVLGTYFCDVPYKATKGDKVKTTIRMNIENTLEFAFDFVNSPLKEPRIVTIQLEK